jgi:hypothetical protein
MDARERWQGEKYTKRNRKERKKGPKTKQEKREDK